MSVPASRLVCDLFVPATYGVTIQNDNGGLVYRLPMLRGCFAAPQHEVLELHMNYRPPDLVRGPVFTETYCQSFLDPGSGAGDRHLPHSPHVRGATARSLEASASGTSGLDSPVASASHLLDCYFYCMMLGASGLQAGGKQIGVPHISTPLTLRLNRRVHAQPKQPYRPTASAGSITHSSAKAAISHSRKCSSAISSLI